MPKPSTGDPAPDVTLVNRNGRNVQLSARWRRRPLVAVFLRHFG
jgi:peroxiredoxin